VTQLNVNNPIGDIRVRTVPHPRQLTIISNIQQKKDGATSIQVQAEQKETVASVSIVYKEGEPASGKRVDLTLLVPESWSITLETKGGKIDARGIKQAIEGRSFSGKILIRGSNKITTSNYQGATQVYFMDNSEVKAQKQKMGSTLESTIGPIEAHFGLNALVKIEASTQGEITSDYSMEIKSKRGSKQKQMTLMTDTPLWELRVSSKQGPIKFLRYEW